MTTWVRNNTLYFNQINKTSIRPKTWAVVDGRI